MGLSPFWNGIILKGWSLICPLALTHRLLCLFWLGKARGMERIDLQHMKLTEGHLLRPDSEAVLLRPEVVLPRPGRVHWPPVQRLRM